MLLAQWQEEVERLQCLRLGLFGQVPHGHMLCAACFEEWNDAEAEKDPEQYYPACKAPECRAKTSKFVGRCKGKVAKKR